MTCGTVASHLRYGRHFLLLGCFSAVLIALDEFHFLFQPIPAFALYGALHASALVLALPATGPPRRQWPFVALAALLSVATLGVGVLGRPLILSLPGGGGPYALLGLSSATGAATYGTLVRVWWMPRLNATWLLAIAMNCMLGTLLAYFMLRHMPLLGRWWLVTLWWFALSGGLWLCEMRQGAAKACSET